MHIHKESLMNRLLLVLTLASASLAAGCSSGQETAGGGGTAAPTPMSLHGVVHGGQAPIVGSAVTLYAASQQALATATSVTTATTDSSGNFSLSFTCPSPTAQMYVSSVGGNPGGGANSAIHLMAILGQCQSLHRSVTVNELTTVAAAYTANPFIGPSGCSDCGGGTPDAVDNISGPAPGLPNAMGNAALLVNTITGLAASLLPAVADCGVASPPANCVLVRRLNSLGNALAACVNSSGPASAQCAELFNCAVPRSTYTSNACTLPAGATPPTDTMQAVLDIARNPAAVSLTGIYQTAAQNVVFSPKLIATPTDLTLSLNLTGRGFSSPIGVAIDASGNVWVTNYNGSSVTKLSPNGTALSGAGFSGSGFAVGSSPYGIAIDASGNAWVANYASSYLDVLDPSGNLILGSPISTDGISSPTGVAIAPSGNVWVANGLSAGTVSEFNSVGAASGTSGFAVGNAPIAVAIDAGGDVWVSNSSSNNVSQLNPSGGLVNTVTAGAINHPLGLAVDPSGNIWVANNLSASVTELTVGSDVVLSGTNFTGGGLNSPTGLAIDAAGNVWVANLGNNGLTELNSSGVALSPASGFVGSGPAGLEYPAIDPSGNIWVPNFSNNSVTVFFGAAAPTRTPLVEAIAHGFAP
jgi:streptogramin lyase